MTYVLRDERAALSRVAQFLREDALHVENFPPAHLGDVGFNMQTACINRFDCGTIACIGGHAWLVENPGDYRGADEYVCATEEGSPLDALYRPRAGVHWSRITPSQAAAAIDNYLAAGDPKWREVMAQ